jgi:hypothetical protein
MNIVKSDKVLRCRNRDMQFIALKEKYWQIPEFK